MAGASGKVDSMQEGGREEQWATRRACWRVKLLMWQGKGQWWLWFPHTTTLRPTAGLQKETHNLNKNEYYGGLTVTVITLNSPTLTSEGTEAAWHEVPHSRSHSWLVTEMDLETHAEWLFLAFKCTISFTMHSNSNTCSFTYSLLSDTYLFINLADPV